LCVAARCRWAASGSTSGAVPPAVPHIAVVGRGTVEASPDYADISFGVVLVGESVPEVKTDVDAKVGKLLAALQRLQVPTEHIRASELTIAPRYDHSAFSVDILGYEVGRTVDLRLTDLDSFNQLLDEAVKSGVTQFYGAAIKSNIEDELRSKARSKAIADAKAQAVAIAVAFGEELGPIHSVTTSAASRATRHAVYGDPAGPEAALRPGPIRVSESVYAVFSIKHAD
jgi:uncharacterized protein YggE